MVDNITAPNYLFNYLAAKADGGNAKERVRQQIIADRFERWKTLRQKRPFLVAMVREWKSSGYMDRINLLTCGFECERVQVPKKCQRR